MYDARPNNFLGNSNLMFGMATLVVVGGCFFGALMIPGLGGNGDAGAPANALSVAEAEANAAATNPEALNTAMATEDEQRLLKALFATAPGRFVDLQRTFATGPLEREAQIAEVQGAVIDTIKENASVLTYASAASLNRVIDGAIGDLRTAQAAGTRFCQGSTYAHLADAPQSAVTQWIDTQTFESEDGYRAAIRLQADLLDLVRQAQTNPARHGLFTKGDEAELQRVMIGIMADPAVIAVVTAGEDKTQAVNGLDICALGVKALTSLRTLPDETKGRAWAAMLSQPKVKQAIRAAQQDVAS